MEKPLDLLNRFTESKQNADEKAAGEYRDQILNVDLTSEAAVMALYRLGLYTLHQEKQLDAAIEIFKNAASSNIACDDRFEAQITYAICLWAKRKQAQAIFELRRLLSEKIHAVHKAMALDYLALFLRESRAAENDIAKVDEQRIEVLGQLGDAEKNIDSQSQIKLRLAIALEERSEVGDLENAKTIVKKVVGLAPKLSRSTASAAREALRRLSKISRK